MNRLFWGLIFVLLDWKLTLGTAVIQVLPDFVGFYLMMKGMESLGARSRAFDRGRHGAFALALISGILFGADLVDPDTGTRVLLWVLGLLTLVGTLILIRVTVRGLQELGLETRNLQGMWLVLAALQSICYLANWIPLVGSICDIVSLGTGVLFLAAVWDTIRKPLG